MQNSVVRVKNLLKNSCRNSVPKGEVWVGSAFLKSAGLEDTLENHFCLAAQLGHDMVCLPLSEKPERNSSLGYRYFEPRELSSDFRDRTLFLSAVIDGPFQRMVNQRGLMEVLMGWTQDKASTLTAYAEERKTALELIDQCLEKAVDAIIFADDLAGEQAPFINPLELDTVCTPFYMQAVSSIRKAGVLVLLHCCGNLQQLIPLMKSWNLDGLAAIQVSHNDLGLLDKEIGGILIAGIEATLLEKDTPSPDEMEALKRFVAHYAAQERLILSSNCGLYRPDFWGRLQRIYRALELNGCIAPV